MSDALAAEKYQRMARLHRAFTPSSPISDADLFRGRSEQLDVVIGAITQVGQHAIVYGDRGVGKTSLVNVVEPILQRVAQNTLVRAIRVNCDATDSFGSIWRKVFREVPLVDERPLMGFGNRTETTTETAAKLLPETRVTPSDVQRVLRFLGDHYRPVVILDEFDRVKPTPATALIADTIKGLSDQQANATVILVGVADSVEGLVREHASIDRSLVQVRMPRMSDDEVEQIVTSGVALAEMTSDRDAVATVVELSRGLPHYAHLLALGAGLTAVDGGRLNITSDDVMVAVKRAVAGAQETITRLHYKATTSSHKENLYAHVLLACALASADGLGYFQPAAVAAPLKRIVGRDVQPATYSRHLTDFCELSRGPVSSAPASSTGIGSASFIRSCSPT